jgi:phage host-nuclease inhibitor protein Gam
METLLAQIEEEKREKQRLQAEVDLEAERKLAELEDVMRRKLESEMNQKMQVIDEQYKRENNDLKTQIEIIKGNYQDMRTNLYKNE